MCACFEFDFLGILNTAKYISIVQNKRCCIDVETPFPFVI